MANRHLSLIDYFIAMDQKLKPSMSFNGISKQDWVEWRQRFTQKVMELLGPMPSPVPVNEELIWKIEENGIIKEKLFINTEELATVPIIRMYRSDLNLHEKHPAILCIHGHGPYGKDSTAGFRVTEDRTEKINEANYDFALQLCQRGYVTYSPDIRGFGERQDQGNPYPGRDSCNVHFIRGLLMGIPLITLNLWDLMNVITFMEKTPFVDSDRIGCIGLSMGGTLSIHLTAIDERIKCADIVCAMTTYKEYAVKMGNFCGSQFIPNIYQYGDLKDIVGLIAPRPILIENGVHDQGFPIEATLEAIEKLRDIYKAADALDDLHTDIFNGDHAFSGRKAFSFFDKYL